MQKIRILAMGRLTEAAFRDAAAEYARRIGRFFDLTVQEIRPEPLGQNPSPAEIARALDREADRILEAVPPRAVLCALCVEGRQMSSEAFARWIESRRREAGRPSFSSAPPTVSRTASRGAPPSGSRSPR